MGTNYYIKQKPLIDKVNRLTCLIENTLDQYDADYREIRNLVDELYGERTQCNLNGNIIHIGKNSHGWKFLWNPNIIKVSSYKFVNGKLIILPPIYDKVYDLTKESIREFIMRPENILEDEYGEIQNKEEFLEWTFNKDGYDSESYNKEHDIRNQYPETGRQTLWRELGYTFDTIYQTDFYNDGLRFSTSIEFS